MMRKCLLGIKERAERLAAERHRSAAVPPAGQTRPTEGAGDGAWTT